MYALKVKKGAKMIKSLKTIKPGKKYYLEQENTKQIAIFEHIERASLDEFIFEDERHQKLKLNRNTVKRILTEYNGDLDGISCENCRYYSTENVRKDKNKAIANCLRCGWEIYHKTPCYGYEEKIAKKP